MRRSAPSGRSRSSVACSARDEIDDRVGEPEARRNLDRAVCGRVHLDPVLAEEALGEIGVDGCHAAGEIVQRGRRRLGWNRCPRYEPKPSSRSTSTLTPLSSTRSAPVAPQSTTSSCTYSGMSDGAATSMTSTGALRHGNASAFPGLLRAETTPSRSATAGSRSRPFDGMAMVSRRDAVSCGLADRARPVPVRPRRSHCATRVTSSSRRSSARPPRDTGGLDPATAPPASGASSPRSPAACRSPGRTAAPRPAFGG